VAVAGGGDPELEVEGGGELEVEGGGDPGVEGGGAGILILPPFGALLTGETNEISLHGQCVAGYHRM